MTQDELKMVLEAMESVTVECNNFHHPKKDQNHHWAKCQPVARWDKAIIVIKEALADHIPDTTKMVSQPEQEPVIDKSAAIRIATTLGWTPPRTWVGLTDEEIDNINYTSAHMLASEVEARLKERNT